MIRDAAYAIPPEFVNRFSGGGQVVSVYLAGSKRSKAESPSELNWRKAVLLRHFGSAEGRELVREFILFDPERWLGTRSRRADEPAVAGAGAGAMRRAGQARSGAPS